MGIFDFFKKKNKVEIIEPEKEVIEELDEDTPEEKETTTLEENNQKRKQQYHVSQHKDGWKVKLSSGAKAIKVFKTQAEAIEYAKNLSLKHNTSYQIHKKDGSIRKKKY